MQNCRIDDIARIAEVSRAAFYFHFPTKDAVLMQLAHEAEDAVNKALDALPQEHTVMQLLEAVTGASGAFWKDKRELVADTYGAVLRALATSSDEDYFQARQKMVGLFKRQQDKGQIIKDFPAEVLTEAFLSAVMVVTVGWVRKPEVQPLELQMKRVAQVIYRSLRPD